MTARVGFLGLGTMGFAMARRLIQAGHEVHVWNRSKDPVSKLVTEGATEAASPENALSVGTSFSMLANDSAAEAVLCREALQSAKGGLHVNMASVSPGCSSRLKRLAGEEGVGYLAAPVLGRPAVAETGNLNILAAGDENLIGRASQFLDAMGSKTWNIGNEPERANIVKVAVNYNIIHAIQALAESITMVERNGLVGQDFVELLTKTLFDGVVYQGYGKLIADQTYLPQGFSLELGLKDLSLAEQIAKDGGTTLPSAPSLRKLFEEAMTREDLQHLDWSALAEVTRKPGK